MFALSGRHSFSAPTQRGTRTASACSPLTGGEFSAEPQRGDSPSVDGGNVPRPAAGAKRKDNLRFSFLFELLPFPCFLIWRRLPTCDRFEKKNGKGFLLPCRSQPVRRVRYRSATQVRGSTQARHKVNCPKGKRGSPGGYPCCATRRHVVTPSTYESICLVEFICAGAVYHKPLTNRAALSCRTQRR